MVRRIGTMRSKFTFIGADGSLGYKHGREYTLSMDFHDTLGGRKLVYIYPEANSGAKMCIYDSMQSFQNNWIRTRKYKRIFSEVDPYGEENWD